MGRMEIAQKIVELVSADEDKELITLSITCDSTGFSVAVIGNATDEMVVNGLQQLNHYCIDQIVMNSQELPN